MVKGVSRDDGAVLVRQLRLGPNLLQIRRTSGDRRFWLEQTNARRRWLTELEDGFNAYRTDPWIGDPYWILAEHMPATTPGRLAGVKTVVVALDGHEVGRSAVESTVWLVGLPPAAARWRPAIAYVANDGKVLEEWKSPLTLEETLGTSPDESPDGGGWVSYAPVSNAEHDIRSAPNWRPPPEIGD